MPEEKNNRSKEPFIKEKIAGPNPKKKRRKIAFVLGLSVLGGVLAAIAFAVTLWMLPGPKDKEPETMETPQETTPPETETETPLETEPPTEEAPDIGELVDEYLEQNVPGMTSIIDYAQNLYKEVSKCLVDVVITKTDTDWMYHTYEKGGTLKGAIVAIQGGSMYVLTDQEDLVDAERIQVMIQNAPREAELYASDEISGMQLLRVAVGDLAEKDLERYQEAVFEDYTLAEPGDFIMAIGNPLGIAGSMDFGFVTYRGKTTESVDAHYDIIYTDMNAYEGASGLFVDENGKIIGWITEDYKEAHLNGSLAGVACSNVADIVDGMLSASTIGYLGVVTKDITEVQAGQMGISHGVYVTQALTDGPAFAAGIQNGDVIVACNGELIHNTRILQNLLKEGKAGNYWKFTVLRWSRDAYKEVEVSVALARRP